MSPSVGNFVHDLVEMAKAMEELPLVRAELSEANDTIEGYAKQVQDREMSILRLKSENEELQSRIKTAEANRDDAELRFLEADDHIAAFRRLVSAFSTDTVALLKAIDPPKPEPVAKPVKPEGRDVPTWLGPEPVADVRHDYDPAPQPIAAEGWFKPSSEPIVQYPFEGSGGGLSQPLYQEPTTAAPSSAVAGDGTVSQGEGVSVQSDPSASPAASTTTSIPTTASSPDVANPVSAPEDDVGYHNEPVKYSGEWYTWASRMDRKYGPNYWPNRP